MIETPNDLIREVLNTPPVAKKIQAATPHGTFEIAGVEVDDELEVVTLRLQEVKA